MSWLSRPWLLMSLASQARLAWRLVREPQVPLLVKSVIPAAGVYLLSPIDLLPDFLPGLGQIDDVALIIAAVTVFLRLCPPAAVAFHRAASAAGRPFAPMPASDIVIDAQFRRG